MEPWKEGEEMIGFFDSIEYDNTLKNEVIHDFYHGLNGTDALRLLSWHQSYGLKTHNEKVHKMSELLHSRPIYWTSKNKRVHLSFEYRTAIWACYLDNRAQPFIIYLSNKGLCIEVPEPCEYREELAKRLISVLSLDEA